MRFLAVAACVGGCSSSPVGNSFQGTVSGQPVLIADGVSARYPQGPGMGYADILMSTTEDLCTDLAANVRHADEKTVEVLLVENTPTADLVPTKIGTYAVGGDTLRAVLGVFTYDAQCQPTFVGAVSGAVELRSIDGDVFRGSFDVTLESGDHVTGSFEPAACPALVGSGAPTCM